ncbi:MAG: TIGR00282 family metallophosphoesterase [Chloroflexota bacterium]
MRIMMVADIVGRPGREAVRQLLPALRREYAIDLVIANGENAAGGRGLSLPTAGELFEAGIDVITLGNHAWAQRDLVAKLDQLNRVIRPLNYPPGAPGRGYTTVGPVTVVNLIGRVFMGTYDCPFRAMDALLSNLPGSRIIIVDFHAEATAEKVALGWHLAGRVSAVLGTHTHVGTTDTRILPGGTAYVTDVGMTGPWNSVIGHEVKKAVERFLTLRPVSVEVADGPVVFNSVVVEVDDETGRAQAIWRLDRIVGD